MQERIAPEKSAEIKEICFQIREHGYKYVKNMKRRAYMRDFLREIESVYPGPDFNSNKERMMQIANEYQLTYNQVYKIFWDIRNRR